MTTLRNASRRRRPGSVGARDDRMTIDYTRFYIFLGVVAILVIAVIANLYFNVIDNEDDEETYTDTVTIKCYNDSHRIVPNGTAEFVLFVENSAGSDTSNFVLLEIIDKPDGWEASITSFLKIGKESRDLGFLTVKGPPDIESGIFNFTVRATSRTFEGESSITEVFVKPEPRTDDRVVESLDDLTTDYVGYLEDGRVFDTSVGSVAFSDVPKTDDFQVRGSIDDYSPFSFTHDNDPRDVIPGFDAGVAGMMIDQTKVIVVPPSEGYTQEGHALYGHTLYFELTLEDIDRN